MVGAQASDPEGQDRDLDDVTGYVLKRAANALRAGLEAAVRPLGLTVPQYACLELLQRHPGLSSSELARGAFVSRQAMNGVLSSLQTRGLVTRPAVPEQGRALPARLTPEGRERLHAAARAVNTVERRMFSALNPEAQGRLRADLRSCIAALSHESVP